MEPTKLYISVHENQNIYHSHFFSLDACSASMCSLILLYRFEGFAIDLADALSKILHFNYTFKIVDDGKVLMSRK